MKMLFTNLKISLTFILLGFVISNEILDISKFSSVCKSTPELDVVYAVDNTISMLHSAPKLKEFVFLMSKNIAQEYPGSRYSLITFNDKPHLEMSKYKENYCAKVETPFIQDPLGITHIMDGISFEHGGKYQNPDVWGGVLYSTLHSSLTWQPFSLEIKRLRILIIITDMLPYDGSEVWPAPLDILVDIQDETNYQCLLEKPPTILQAKKALEKIKTLNFFVILDGYHTDYEKMLESNNIPGIVTKELDIKPIYNSIQEKLESLTCKVEIKIDKPAPIKIQLEKNDKPLQIDNNVDESEERSVQPGIIVGATIAAGVCIAAGFLLGYKYIFQRKQEFDESHYESSLNDSSIDGVDKEQVVATNYENYV